MTIKNMYNLVFILLAIITSTQAMEEVTSFTKLPKFKCKPLEQLFLNTPIEISLEEAQVIDALTKPQSDWKSFWSIVSGNISSPIIDNDALQELKEKIKNTQEKQIICNLLNAKDSYAHRCPIEIQNIITNYYRGPNIITLSGKAFKECCKALYSANQTNKSNLCSTFVTKNKSYTSLSFNSKIQYPICCTFDKLAYLITQINTFTVALTCPFENLQIVLKNTSEDDIKLYEQQLNSCGLRTSQIKIWSTNDLFSRALKQDYT